MIFHNSYNIILNIIRVGYLCKHPYVNSPYNAKILRLLEKLIQLRYVNRYEIMDNNILRIILIYDINGCSNYRYTKILFKPSHRTYISYKRLIILYKYDFGIVYILSTSHGLLTHSEAISLRVGGELICVLYS
jgi:ribosomal protein S8